MRNHQIYSNEEPSNLQIPQLGSLGCGENRCPVERPVHLINLNHSVFDLHKRPFLTLKDTLKTCFCATILTAFLINFSLFFFFKCKLKAPFSPLQISIFDAAIVFHTITCYHLYTWANPCISTWERGHQFTS